MLRLQLSLALVLSLWLAPAVRAQDVVTSAQDSIRSTAALKYTATFPVTVCIRNPGIAAPDTSTIYFSGSAASATTTAGFPLLPLATLPICFNLAPGHKLYAATKAAADSARWSLLAIPR